MEVVKNKIRVYYDLSICLICLIWFVKLPRKQFYKNIVLRLNYFFLFTWIILYLCFFFVHGLSKAIVVPHKHLTLCLHPSFLIMTIYSIISFSFILFSIVLYSERNGARNILVLQCVFFCTRFEFKNYLHL